MKKIILILFILSSIKISAQTTDSEHLEKALVKFDLLEQKIIQDSDTITYYLKNYKEKPSKLVVFIQGSDANPLFSYDMNDAEPIYYRWFLDDYQHLDSSYTYAIIPKPGMEGIYREEHIGIPAKYYENNFREYRVNQVHQSIDHIVDNHLMQKEQVIVYGHSEGAAIGAALAQVNNKITHLGFWSGNVLNNFYEFSLFDRIEALKGNQSDSIAHENIMGLIAWYQNVMENPNSTELDQFGFTNKRWATYGKPPIEDLLSVDIPVYCLFGSKDESTPIETAYLIPIQFMQHGKTNLTFEVCMNCDHGYVDRSGEKEINHWDRLFGEFMQWTEK